MLVPSTKAAGASGASAAKNWAGGTARCVPVLGWKGRPSVVFYLPSAALPILSNGFYFLLQV